MSNTKNNTKMKIISFIVIVLITFAIVIPSSLFTNTEIYSDLVQPIFAPPSYLFGIVWPILYVLMAISAWLVYNTEGADTKFPLRLYLFQLVMNAIWPIIFFNFELYLLAFVWLCILLFFVVYMAYEFYKINKVAGLLQIPYILWLIFAGALNLAIFILN